ncbi:hypothetical protein [Streptomyces sp. NPDC007991]|uniref:hypothetical protein n=1 Tax=Streptomyces sp. NPDC007991 TaxID=3364803 RepID=UPI0036EBE4AA
MIRALVRVWLFGGLRMDEIRRLELECVRWDQATDPDSGETYRVCLPHIPANKTTAAFSKPVDPIVGELIDAWKTIRPVQPDITDRKTGQRRRHMFFVHPVAGTVWAYEGATFGNRVLHMYFPKTGMIIAIAVNSAVGEGDTLPDLAGTVYKTLSAQKAQALPRHQ